MHRCHADKKLRDDVVYPQYFTKNYFKYLMSDLSMAYIHEKSINMFILHRNRDHCQGYNKLYLWSHPTICSSFCSHNSSLSFNTCNTKIRNFHNLYNKNVDKTEINIWKQTRYENFDTHKRCACMHGRAHTRTERGIWIEIFKSNDVL